MRSLLKSKKFITPDQSRRSNPDNGSDAETLAAAQLATACRGEVRWGSREEDNSKIDLVLSINHPWHSKERMFVLTQVKSGNAYGSKIGQGFLLKTRAIKEAKRTSHSICILWVCRDSNHVFWSYVHPSSKVSVRKYSLYHQVSPATLYDLARCMSKDTTSACGGNGIIIRQRDGNHKKRRKLVYLTYKNMDQIFSPVLGAIELTRLGWRHMFRANRSKYYKQNSLDLIPYLERIINQSPTDNAITNYGEWDSNGFVYRSTEHLLKYDKVMCAIKLKPERKSATVIIKVIEEIRYPKNWQTNAMLSQCVDRRLVLKSAYYKVNS